MGENQQSRRCRVLAGPQQLAFLNLHPLFSGSWPLRNWQVVANYVFERRHRRLRFQTFLRVNIFFVCSIILYNKLLNVINVGYGRFWRIPPLQTSTNGLQIANRRCVSCCEEFSIRFLRCGVL
ncbi:unnamed protein product [Chondrus crispus]|uniref:Uncharacterized protein n=1 Tax=Chondrus crispus TaxID=2769 RepID=R7QE71_CHOCR|nr:unnamed protein product [Chondrus crispus]CDF35756.1 unnamed protein product [Chondrus crispus]|eukprot:XP_005715575.1 unnamed protein product [Chondrus crispus]